MGRYLDNSDNSKRRELTPLKVGDSVQVQNQTGNHPSKWNNTGVISDVLPNRQYHVIMDGSRRVSLRNRRFLKKFMPVSRKNVDHTFDSVLPPAIPDGYTQPAPKNVDTTQILPTTNDTSYERQVPFIDDPGDILGNRSVGDERTRGIDASKHVDTAVPPELPVNEVRRSTRSRVPRKLFQAQMKGKTHE